MNSIRSFAILDIETSDSPRSAFFNNAKITELCIHALSASDIRNGDPNKSPRTLHKLRMPFNPGRRIHLNTSTGLDNFMLEHESRFDRNSANILISFLNKLQQPTCLVAHNGTNFDFPLLKKTLRKLEMQLPPDCLCLDSLIAFPAIDKSDAAILRALKELNNDYDIVEFLQIAERLEASSSSSSIEKPKLEDIICLTKDRLSLEEPKDNFSSDEMQNTNETTPKRLIKTNFVNIVRKNSLDEINWSQEIDFEKTKCRRSLFTSDFPPKGIYGLGDMYKRIFNIIPQNTHQAEADVFLLRRIILYYGVKFLDFADGHAVPFSSIDDF